MRSAILLGAAIMLTPVSSMAGAEDAANTNVSVKLIYPKTKTVNVVDEQFGVKVEDPYRWLEDDVRVNPEVADWVKAQNAVTDAYLETLPGKKILGERMKKLFDYERFGLPEKAGGYYFFTKNDGLQNQSVLYVRKGLKGADRVLIDPNSWAKDGATALDSWVPSKNGTLLAYSIQDGGSDWRTLKVIDSATGKVLPDEIKWAKFTNISWVGNDGFLYSRFAEPKKGAAFQQLNYNQTVYYHKIGTPQSEDKAVYATPDKPEYGYSAQVTHDGKWAVITTSSGTDEKYELHVMLLGKKPTWKAQPLVTGLEYDWGLIEGMGNILWFTTNKDAPKLKVVTVDLGAKTPVFVDVIPEREETLSRTQIVGNRLILSYIKDAKSMALMTDLAGKPVQEIKLNAIGTASGFSGTPGDPETFFGFSSFNQPGAVYRFNSDTGVSTVFAQPKLSFDPQDYSVAQIFYPSKDGTKIPMFVVHKKDLDLSQGAPTLLYSYGGFNISQTPTYSPTRMAWLQSGGVFALANIRGGGEYGKPWHDAGRLMNKQNVFDDFAAAAEYLIASGISAKGKIAIEGRSNGGLLIGASLNQRPDLFAAGHAAVGVMDMVRFDRFTAGRYWVDDYGYPSKEADFKMQMTYSPYHNIKSGVAYPAVIVSTADTDDRVVPGHSFKYISALQAADTGSKPKIIRIESRAGHGSGKPTDKVIEEYSYIYAFLAKWTGLKLAE
ncbi:prolyl oligopeptidase family serine peptidase [Sphingorhabdus sp.]|uniref:prolyl oligopeptidase family serine peptidase n=1 Tax=Sphingorhabdus sp. TaxID=1902408 RepID=UPI00261091DC|nr:prolyl oligopeptidase family serine peptidase [Sphingorhabdus sp.]MDH4399537.1 prolyl oligopeptidase family serine peptidase [Sphingorhabdus sp.]